MCSIFLYNYDRLQIFSWEQTQNQRVCLHTIWSWSQELYRYETGFTGGKNDPGQPSTEVQNSQDWPAPGELVHTSMARIYQLVVFIPGMYFIIIKSGLVSHTFYPKCMIIHISEKVIRNVESRSYCLLMDLH